MGSAVLNQLDLLRTALADRYELDREIGRGGMSYVYRAYDKAHGRSVAIKLLRPDLGAALGAERFLREIQIEARLQHPHILPLYDSGTAHGLLYYVMPWVEGESLRERIRREKQLSVPEAVRIACEVADALEYAHTHGVIHRDIKPGNILLSDGHALVADFGIAKAMSAAEPEELTASGMAIGTPEYMSPEQGSGHDGIDGRTDIYALGCVLYEMLAGVPPFTGRTAQAILARHLHDLPPALRTIRPSLPAAVQQAVERALEKVAADRFPTAAAFVDSLSADRITAARPIPRRRLIGSAVITLGLLATLAGVVMLISTAGRTPAGVGVVIAPFDPTPGERNRTEAASGQAMFTEAVEWVPALRALDGSSLLAPGGSARTTQLPDLLRGAERIGGKYLVTGTVLPGAEGTRLAVDLYSIGDGERILRVADTATGGRLDGAVGRLAIQAIRALAEREQLDLGARKAMFSSTASATAVGQLMQGQTLFWQGNYEGAAAAYAQAIEADSACALAYLRLGSLHSSRQEYPAALAILEAGLRHRARMASRWVNLLEARRHYALGEGETAVFAFQNAVLDDREDVDAWLGLGESIFHLGAYSGHSPLEAEGALERTVELDSAFFPIYDHLVDIALYKGDSARAERYVRRMPSGDPATLARREAIALRFYGTAAKEEAHRRLRHVDRQALSRLVVLWTMGAADLPLADTLSSYLMESGRTPDDRRRGAQYRLVTLAGQGRWPEALSVWQREGAEQPFDAWVVHAHLAGYPAEAVVGPMLEWARLQLRRGVIPDFSLPPWDERQQAFQAVAHQATLSGDSVEVMGLLGRMRSANRTNDPSDPTAGSLEASLEARLALLAGDSAEAIASLQQSLTRINHPFTWYYPLTSMAVQRRLLSELLQGHAPAEARRWRESFQNSWSIGDVLFAVPPPKSEETHHASP